MFKELKEDSYKVLLILDSLDECNSDSIHGQMTRFEKNNSFLNESGIDYKVLVGLRSGLFEQTGIREVTNRLKNYTVKDFDKSNVEEYLEKLVESNIIKKKQLDTIKTSIKLLTIHDRINPFLLAMIIDNYSYLNNDKNVIVDDIKPIKIVDLINDSAERQIIKVNDSRVGVVTYNTNPNPNTLNIVGIRGLMENKETIDKARKLYNCDGIVGQFHAHGFVFGGEEGNLGIIVPIVGEVAVHPLSRGVSFERDLDGFQVAGVVVPVVAGEHQHGFPVLYRRDRVDVAGTSLQFALALVALKLAPGIECIIRGHVHPGLRVVETAEGIHVHAEVIIHRHVHRSILQGAHHGAHEGGALVIQAGFEVVVFV